jgi:hypothetical protein
MLLFTAVTVCASLLGALASASGVPEDLGCERLDGYEYLDFNTYIIDGECVGLVLPLPW